MKALILVLALMASSAFTAEVKIFEVGTFGKKWVTGEFGFNESLERVWVNLDISDNFASSEDTRTDSYRVKVPELTYDAASKTAVLTVDGQAFECAAIRQRGVLIFRHNYLKRTNCEFKTKVVSYDYDNGYEILKRKLLQVYIVTK